MAQSFSNILGNKTPLSRQVGSINPTQGAKQMGSQYQINRVTRLMEPKKAGIAFPAMSALGVAPKSTQLPSPPMATNNQSAPTSYAPAQGTQPNNQNISGQLDSIKNQALGIQGLLNQRNSSQSSGDTGNQKNFAGILSSLLGASKPTSEQNRTRKEMERIAAGNKAIGDEAKRTSDMYAQEIARVGNLGAGAVAGNLSTGTNVVGSGNAAIASQSASQRIQALGTAQKAALEGTGQQLTGQQQTAEAFQPSLGAALTQQQQQLSGLGTAAGLAAPMQIPYSAGGFDPVTGQQIAGGFGGWAGYTTATQVQDLISQYPDAGVQYNPAMTPEQNLQMVQQALGGSPSYQRGTFGAAGANSYIGGAQLGAAADLTGKVAQIQTQGAAADSNFNLMLDIMKRGQINDLNQPALNQLVQSVSRGLASDTDVVAFRSALQTVRSQYAAILGGGTPTDATQSMAAEKIPDTVSLGALQEVEKTMKSMVSNTVAAYNQTIGSYSGGSGGGGGGGSSYGAGVTWDSLLD